MKLGTKIVFFVIAMISVSVLIIGGLGIFESASYNEKISYERINSASEDLNNTILTMLEHSKKNAFSISHDYLLISAMKQQDFGKTKAALDELNEYLKADTISITDLEGNVIIRQHEPTKFGDNILKQTNVQKALKGEILTTLEPGALVKLSCRTGAPIYDDEGTLIGTVVTGYTFENSDFLDELKALHKTELTIFAGDESIASTIIKDGKRQVGTKLKEKTAKIVLEEKQEYTGDANFFDSSYITKYTPIFDSEGNVVGATFAGMPKDDATRVTRTTILHMGVAALLIMLLCTLFLLRFVEKSIKKPMLQLTGISNLLAQGRLDVDVSEAEDGKKDEIAVLAEAMNEMVSQLRAYISDIIHILSSMSKNDFTATSSIHYQGDFTSIGESLAGISSHMNEMLHVINITAEQVSAGAEQVANGAQALAEGSTEQASLIEKLDMSIEDIARKANQNLGVVYTAADSVRKASEDADAGNSHMRQLTEAMEEINSSSNQIAGITKVIEDIAFQTNILALNAAIEAARAGNAGKGFAVVADEVRNLAAKSAEAASQTGELIRTSVSSVIKGTDITEKTVEILKNLEVSSCEATESFVKIEESSREQVEALEQIKEGLFRISAVVQTNAATAEENSAASEEMSAQAVTLRDEVEKFKLKEI